MNKLQKAIIFLILASMSWSFTVGLYIGILFPSLFFSGSFGLLILPIFIIVYGMILVFLIFKIIKSIED